MHLSVMFAAGRQKLGLFRLECRTVLQCNRRQGHQAKEEFEGAGTGRSRGGRLGYEWKHFIPNSPSRSFSFGVVNSTPCGRSPLQLYLYILCQKENCPCRSSDLLPFPRFLFQPKHLPLGFCRHSTAAALSSPAIYDDRPSRWVLPVALSAALCTLQHEQKKREKKQRVSLLHRRAITVATELINLLFPPGFWWAVDKADTSWSDAAHKLY